nr:hypothetical protein [Tanacetum cinerariifolium]
MSISALMKCTAAIRQFAYDSIADTFDEYLQMSEHTARDALFFFNMCIIELYMPKYLRKPTSEDVVNIQQKHNNVHGFPGMLRSIDSGENNDINELDNSPLFDDLLDNLAHAVPYVVNRVEYHNGYYLADGIYPECASFVKSFTVATDPKHTYFKQRQESARKDVERAFGVLQGRFGLIQQPAHAYEVNTLRRIMYAGIIMHNMILEDQNMSIEVLEGVEGEGVGRDEAAISKGGATVDLGGGGDIPEKQKSGGIKELFSWEVLGGMEGEGVGRDEAATSKGRATVVLGGSWRPPREAKI